MNLKIGNVLLSVVIVLILATLLTDWLFISKYKVKYNELQKKLIITSNKLTTAKIVHEDMVHVRDLVLKNMDLPDQEKIDSIHHESHFFNFITTCVNDLKLKLISVEPKRPITEGRVTTYTYHIEVEGDFFKFGELCSKLENSRRIISLENYQVTLIDKEEKAQGGAQNKKIVVEMKLDTYRVKKAPSTSTTTVAKKDKLM